MKMLNLACIMLSLFILGGCAHSIVISPNVEKVGSDIESRVQIKKNVAYYISDIERDLEVNSPGGGGDSVEYFPYRDIEVGFEKMLSNVFVNVKKLKDPQGTNRERIIDIDYLIKPEIITISQSASSVTWPPTNFVVDLTCNIMDGSWNVIEIIKVIGEGRAEMSEMRWTFDRGLAGRRAMEDALMKMKRALFTANYTNSGTKAFSKTPAASKDSTLKKLETLKDFSDRGLITTEEFNKKKKEILDGM